MVKELPFHVTIVDEVNAVPLTVSVKAGPPGTTELGEILDEAEYREKR